MKRRQFLTVAGATVPIALAGCAGDGNGDDDGAGGGENGDTNGEDSVPGFSDAAFQTSLEGEGLEIDHYEVTDGAVHIDYISAATEQADVLNEIAVVLGSLAGAIDDDAELADSIDWIYMAAVTADGSDELWYDVDVDLLVDYSNEEMEGEAFIEEVLETVA